jgi:predicted RNA binding protein YcfA (HicA-like mRNA interferase family)
MTFRDIEKLVKKDGWKLQGIQGSHYHYKHDTKSGKVTIPYHKGDLTKRTIDSIKKQAGLN